MEWNRLAVPVLALGAMVAFGMLLASESLVQSLSRAPLEQDQFLALARAGADADSGVPAWGGPVATWSEGGRAALRDQPVELAEPPSGSGWVLPLAGWWGLTDRFGEPRGEDRFHTGLDIGLAGWEASPVYSACNGTVVVAEMHETYGNHVIVDCGDGWSTVSAHFSRLTVRTGDTVAAGSTILGISGSTGLSTGEHLHFEVRYQGVPIDPELVLSFE